MTPPLVVAPVPDDVPPVDDPPIAGVLLVPADPLSVAPLPLLLLLAPAAKARLLDAASTAASINVLKFMILSLVDRTEG